MNKIKVILIHGNGGGWPKENWLPRVAGRLKRLGGVKVIFRQFPDPVLARAKYWLPFIKKLGADENTILVGHSSGAVAAMRYAERHKILGSILVAACHTDLGVAEEKISGYFKKPWNWKAIRKNQKWIEQFASIDDQFIPIKEARFVSKKLKTEYHEFKHQGHFSSWDDKTDFPQIVTIIKKKLKI
ncbi:MAG: alpha/beta hydrolase [Candidatus Taylorbacteria bacterium]|nr:alpha/beta hydrolase [Candidatus Taylorbacteria bacterium]